MNTNPFLKLPSKVMLVFLLVKIATFAPSLLAQEHTCPDDWTCCLCYSGQAYFDESAEVGTCVWVMNYPCQQAIQAYCPGTDCDHPFMSPSADWHFEGTSVGQTAYGLRITPRILSYTASALIEVVDPGD